MAIDSAYLIDTNVFSEMMTPEPAQAVAQFLDLTRIYGHAVSVITVWEIENGIRQLNLGKRRRGLHTMFEGVLNDLFDGRVIPIDRQVAKHCAEIMEIRRRAGRSLDAHLPDALIAATALANGMTLATRDAHDFEGTGLDLVDPWAHTPQG